MNNDNDNASNTLNRAHADLELARMLGVRIQTENATHLVSRADSAAVTRFNRHNQNEIKILETC